METKARNHTSLRISILIMAILFTGQFCSYAYSQDLVVVDGTASRCGGNPLPEATLFHIPEIGHCDGSVVKNCSMRRNDQTHAVIAITACVGTFRPLVDQQPKLASSIANLQQQLQQQIDILKANIKTLSDANDALTKRINDVEALPKKQTQP